MPWRGPSGCLRRARATAGWPGVVRAWRRGASTRRGSGWEWAGVVYQPVAILDDDPAKRRLRIDGVPVLGGRAQMAEVAASTGARVLVIAIAGRSGRVIPDLTEAAERCGLVPKVIPSVRELLTGGGRVEGGRDPRTTDLLGPPAGAAHVAPRPLTHP